MGAYGAGPRPGEEGVQYPVDILVGQWFLGDPDTTGVEAIAHQKVTPPT
ncbi:hypothetical protein GCM10022419_124020 [Nonomuraea rosea]|uniref:Uncharacterized protein n=1 Tax=Nonomuraea rosea TaxID=638574 RepID=A0ABP6ZR44_9ACTN